MLSRYYILLRERLFLSLLHVLKHEKAKTLQAEAYKCTNSK